LLSGEGGGDVDVEGWIRKVTCMHVDEAEVEVEG